MARAVGINTADAPVIAEQERRAWVNILRESVIRGFDKRAIPSQRIRAALHAAIRMDDRRPFRQNDIADIDHSSVAAAYCDIFLTERSFAELLRRKAVKDVCVLQGEVISDVTEACEAVAAIC